MIPVNKPSEFTDAPRAKMLQLLSTYRLPQLIYVAAELGIADLLKDGSKHFEELASACGAHPDSLYRLLRALASAGIFNRLEGERFELNALGETLCRDVPGSVHTSAMWAGQLLYPTWGGLLRSVKTGESAFQHTHGMSMWEYFEQTPAAGQLFAALLNQRTSELAPAVANVYNFSKFNRIVDVGGGQGVLLATILKANPSAHGILFDQAQVLQGAKEQLATAGVLPRCELVSGDFFDRVPSGGDAYILAHVLHDWNDSKAAQILAACRRAMKENQTLLIIERVVASDQPVLSTTLVDIMTMILVGGRERTEAEHRSLLNTAGFELTDVIATRAPECIIEATSV